VEQAKEIEKDIAGDVDMLNSRIAEETANVTGGKASTDLRPISNKYLSMRLRAVDNSKLEIHSKLTHYDQWISPLMNFVD